MKRVRVKGIWLLRLCPYALVGIVFTWLGLSVIFDDNLDSPAFAFFVLAIGLLNIVLYCVGVRYKSNRDKLLSATDFDAVGERTYLWPFYQQRS